MILSPILKVAIQRDHLTSDAAVKIVGEIVTVRIGEKETL